MRDKIIAVAEKTVMSERAQAVAAETGALVYWQVADDSRRPDRGRHGDAGAHRRVLE